MTRARVSTTVFSLLGLASAAILVISIVNYLSTDPAILDAIFRALRTPVR